ncbi:hypothetical protein ABFS83_12G106700 [Erythranthe nasuta]
MANFFLHRLSNLALLVFVLISSFSLQVLAADEDRKVYIVYMGHLPAEATQSLPSYHFNMLNDVVDSRFVTKSLVRSYTRSFNGFAAYLTPQEKEKLAGHEQVVSIFPSTTFHTQTTRSWDYMGLAPNAKRNPTMESDTIIGVIDTGIWPESESFNDKGFGPPPKKWKGACKGGYNFTCNNKLIGARYYKDTDETARDTEGHGSHTASTAAGNYVKDVSFYGIAKGTARGAVPSARIAAYKVCNPSGCSSENLLAAFDDGIADGADIFSMSIGHRSPHDLEADPIAIGAFHAAEKGILVIQSAGNSGDDKGTVSSVAPWIFSVAASTTDRGIIAKVSLGDGTVLTGKAVNAVSLNGTSFPLVYGEGVSRKCDEQYAKYCYWDCLEPDLVKGKIVLCKTYAGIGEAARAGAVGAVALDDFSPDVSFVVPPIAASALNQQDFNLVESYFSSTKSPKVEVLASESIKNVVSPKVASFSSRGPNVIIPHILKPDVTAPGTEIMAAYSPVAPPSVFPQYDNRSVKYNILAGTSMSCPHVAGASAYVKSLHPDWSPSAIKSALMTTAWRMNSTNDPLAEFGYGVGHIDPARAVDPGLVYETSTGDYANMLCSLGYDNAKLRKIFGGNNTCPTGEKTMPKDLNYPSMSMSVPQGNGTRSTFSANFRRTVTNVGDANSIYKVKTSESPDYSISVTPNILEFGALNEKKTFEVAISGKISENNMVSASLEWSDGVHNVRSPIVVYTDNM